MLEAGHQDEEVLLCHGRSQLQLKQFTEAKQTFERAALRYPSSEKVRTMLTLASNQLGEGDNSSIKSRLEPVETPKAVLAAMPPPRFAQPKIVKSTAPKK